MSESCLYSSDAVRAPAYRRPAVHGRASEVRALVQSLDPSGRRRVTVHGPAGVGTSALVAAAIDRLRDIYPDIATVTARGAPGLRRGLGAHLGVLEPHGLDRLAEAIGPRRLLVVVDPPQATGPHVILAERQMVREAEELVEQCPGLAVVVVSQRPGTWPSARHVAVQPLPPPGADLDPDELRSEPTVALLLERMSLGDSSVRPTDEVVLTAAQVCRAVGGLPLALELTAALVTRLGLDEVADLLDGGPSGVTLLAGRRTEPHGVRTALELSYAALGVDAQQVLREASTLRGPFDLAAARAVTGLSTPRLVDALDTLADLRLVRYAGFASPTGHDDPGPRYALEHTAAELGADLLEHGGDRERVLDRHAAHFAALARAAAQTAADAREDVAHAMLEPATADLAAALSHVRSGPDAQAALRLVLDLPLLSRTVGERDNLLAVVDDLLDELSGEPVDEGLLADAEIWSAALVLDRADASEHVDEALTLLLSGIDRARATSGPSDPSDPSATLRLLRGLAVAARTVPLHGNVVLAHRCVDEGLAVARSAGHERWLARFEAARARLLLDRGDLAGAVRLGVSALGRGRAAADPAAMVAAGVLLRSVPQTAFRAESGLDEAPGAEDLLGLLDSLGGVADPTARSLVLGQLAADASAAGDLPAAAGWVAARLDLAWRRSDRRGIAGSYLAAGHLLAGAGQPRQAARLHGMASAVMAGEAARAGGRSPATGAGAAVGTAPSLDDSATALRSRLGAEPFARAARDGEALDPVAAHHQVVDLLTELQRVGAGSSSPDDAAGDRRQAAPLAEAERELLQRLVDGERLSEVAHATGRSAAEVASVAASLYRRLGVHGRVEAVARATHLTP